MVENLNQIKETKEETAITRHIKAILKTTPVGSTEVKI